MDQVSLPAEASTEDNEAEDSPHQIWPMFSQQTEISGQQDDDTFTYASSIYSDQQANDNFERCCSPSSSTYIRNTQNHPDPALPYLAIVTQLREVVYPSRLDKESRDAKDVRSTSAKRSSTSSSSRCKHHKHTEQQRTTSKTRLGSKPATEHNTFKPVVHTALHSRINSRLKTIQFQDTADNFTAPSLDPNLAKHTQPLGVEKNSIMIKRWPREPRAVLSLRGSGSSRNNLASSPGSALIDERDRSGVGVNEKKASMRVEDGVQAYHPLTNVPVKKGWVRKIARALMERGD